MKIFNVVAVTIVVTSIILSGAARADVIDSSANFQLDNLTNFDSGIISVSDSNTTTTVVSLDRFDSSLGTLTGVEVSFTSAFNHYSYASAYDSSSESYRQAYSCGGWGWSSTCYRTVYDNETYVNGEAHAQLTVDLIDPNGGLEQAFDSNDMYCRDYNRYSGSIACEDYEADINNVFDGTLSLGGVSLAAFIGTDPIDLKLTNKAWFSAACDTYDRGYDYDFCQGSNDTYWGGTMTVQYTYDVVAQVSEPGTLGLLGLGLFGLGVMRRRKIE